VGKLVEKVEIPAGIQGAINPQNKDRELTALSQSFESSLD